METTAAQSLPTSSTVAGAAMSGKDAIIVGAGPAGLACAAMLREIGLGALILEKRDAVGAVWRRHYDCLHLHTERAFSSLPGLPMPRTYPRFPSRLQVIEYLEAYATKFDIRPAYNAEVRAIWRKGAGWEVDCGAWKVEAPVVVVAVGLANFPYRPACLGLEDYTGSVIHSSDYRNATPYAGKRVLVVGFGNSGAEIALDLARANVDTTLSVRGPVQVTPLTILGIPMATLGLFQRKIPARLADLVNVPLVVLMTGNLEKVGLHRLRKGPRRQIEEDNRVPIIDVGAMAKIRAGAIKVRGGLTRFTELGAVFQASPAEAFDAVIFATGFRVDLRPMLPVASGALDASGYPRVSGAPSAEPGLYFCGTTVSPGGMLREIGIEAKRIARLTKERLDEVGRREAA
jgi:cation diffusion facilitator CzcD-associated flavoprotein CzcO